jgi:cell division protein FtsW (lipid II flippase)
MSPASDEIARIEHELDVLRSRYAIFQRLAAVMKWFVVALVVIVPCAIVSYGVVNDDRLIAALALTIGLIVITGLFLRYRAKNFRWIDVASPGLSPADRQSEAAAIETMIAEREQRLAELKRRPA